MASSDHDVFGGVGTGEGCGLELEGFGGAVGVDLPGSSVVADSFGEGEWVAELVIDLVGVLGGEGREEPEEGIHGLSPCEEGGDGPRPEEGGGGEFVVDVEASVGEDTDAEGGCRGGREQEVEEGQAEHGQVTAMAVQAMRMATAAIVSRPVILGLVVASVNSQNATVAMAMAVRVVMRVP